MIEIFMKSVEFIKTDILVIIILIFLGSKLLFLVKIFDFHSCKIKVGCQDYCEKGEMKCA